MEYVAPGLTVRSFVQRPAGSAVGISAPADVSIGFVSCMGCCPGMGLVTARSALKVMHESSDHAEGIPQRAFARRSAYTQSSPAPAHRMLHWHPSPGQLEAQSPYVALQDLELRAIQAFRKLAAQSGRLSTPPLAESDAALVEKLHPTEGAYLKRTATLLFYADPEKFNTGPA